MSIIKNVWDDDPACKAASDLGRAIGAEAVIIVVLKRMEDGRICRKSRLGMDNNTTLEFNDIAYALAHAIDDLVQTEEPS